MSGQHVDLQVQCALRTAVDPTPRVCQIAAMFGLGIDSTRTLDLIAPTTLTLTPGQVVFITGASGGGKSTLLRLIREQLDTHDHAQVIDFDQINTSHDAALVDTFTDPLPDAVRWLSLAGLNDAFVMLRKPRELSDGQRYRFRLAHAMAQAERGEAAWSVVLADEFTSTLDRQTARIIARNMRKWVSRSPARRGVCFIAATTHDDLLESLEPDLLCVPDLGAGLSVTPRPAAH